MHEMQQELEELRAEAKRLVAEELAAMEAEHQKQAAQPADNTPAKEEL